MYSVTFAFSPDIYEAVAYTAAQARPRLRQKMFNIINGPTARVIILGLSTEPSSPDYPINWSNSKQRKAVMRKLRLSNNIPYARSHKEVQGWSMVLLNLSESSGLIGIQNKTPYTDWVQGENQQRYLYKWPLARQIIRDNESDMEEEVSTAWLEATEIKE